MSNMIEKIFNYEETELKVFKDEQGNPWFIAKEVCDILDIRNHRDALLSLDIDTKGVVSTDTLGGMQKVNIVNEPGLYELIANSRKPKAKLFRKWIFSEVLPSIFKTGQYSVKPLTEIDIARNYVKALEDNDKLKKDIKQLKPKADFAECALLPGVNVSINVFAKTNGLKPNLLTRWFRDRKILMSGNYKNDKKHLVPYQEWTKYFECIQETYEKADGTKDFRVKPLVIHDKQVRLLNYIFDHAPIDIFKNKPKEQIKI